MSRRRFSRWPDEGCPPAASLVESFGTRRWARRKSAAPQSLAIGLHSVEVQKSVLNLAFRKPSHSQMTRQHSVRLKTGEIADNDRGAEAGIPSAGLFRMRVGDQEGQENGSVEIDQSRSLSRIRRTMSTAFSPRLGRDRARSTIFATSSWLGCRCGRSSAERKWATTLPCLVMATSSPSSAWRRSLECWSFASAMEYVAIRRLLSYSGYRWPE
jgi:hypothetical protein